MLARNEDWIIGLSARAALEWCDALLVFNHASTDRTGEILLDISREYGPKRLRVLYDADPVWHEMKFRDEMLREARAWWGSQCYMAVVDADEVLSYNLIDKIRPALKDLDRDESLEPPWVGLRGSITSYHTNGIWGTNWVSVGFKDCSSYHWKSRNGYDFHHRRPMGISMRSARPWKQGDGGLLHLQFVSDRRLRAKQAAYKMQEVLRWPGREPVAIVDQRYNPAVYGTKGDVMAETPRNWWFGYSKWMEHLKVDAEPWQEKQCKAWLAEHGRERFEGLDLFGVV